MTDVSGTDGRRRIVFDPHIKVASIFWLSTPKSCSILSALLIFGFCARQARTPCYFFHQTLCAVAARALSPILSIGHPQSPSMTLCKQFDIVILQITNPDGLRHFLNTQQVGVNFWSVLSVL